MSQPNITKSHIYILVIVEKLLIRAGVIDIRKSVKHQFSWFSDMSMLLLMALFGYVDNILITHLI